MKSNVFWHNLSITKEARNSLKGHKGTVIWLTGLSGSGKSTIANAVEHQLYEKNVHSYILDGDNVRHGLNKDLGFSDADRVENIRRSEEHTSELQSRGHLVCRLLLEKKNTAINA